MLIFDDDCLSPCIGALIAQHVFMVCLMVKFGFWIKVMWGLHVGHAHEGNLWRTPASADDFHPPSGGTLADFSRRLRAAPKRPANAGEQVKKITAEVYCRNSTSGEISAATTTNNFESRGPPANFTPFTTNAGAWRGGGSGARSCAGPGPDATSQRTLGHSLTAMWWWRMADGGVQSSHVPGPMVTFLVGHLEIWLVLGKACS